MKTKFEHLFDRVWERRLPFLVVFFVSVFLSYAFLFAVDFIPEAPEEVVEEDQSEEVYEDTTTSMIGTVAAEEQEEAPLFRDPLPHTIIFDTLDNKTVTVLNPESRDISDLDQALLNGAVRHPDSANFMEDGNIFILAHSSYLPNVMNKNFQAFNRIQELDWGDTVRVQSNDYEYTYFVEKVYKAKASEVTVPATPGKARLTLATCNSFGSKDDRFVVEARLVSEKPL